MVLVKIALGLVNLMNVASRAYNVIFTVIPPAFWAASNHTPVVGPRSTFNHTSVIVNNEATIDLTHDLSHHVGIETPLRYRYNKKVD
jgi:hypothetical protein